MTSELLSPPGAMNIAGAENVLGRRAWWRPNGRLITRIALVTGISGVVIALLFLAIGAPYIKRYETQRQLLHIDELISAVENTARIACFTSDQTLATEVARGLAANPAVAIVRIQTRDQLLVETAAQGGEREKNEIVRRELASPFDNRLVVGEVQLTLNNAYIFERAGAYSRFFGMLLIAELVVVMCCLVLVMLRQVVQPISQLAAGLQSIEGRVDKLLPLPEGHETSEIGDLSVAFNRMISGAADLLRRQQAMADEIAQSERRFRTLAENSPDIIVRFESDGTLVFANPASIREAGLAFCQTSTGFAMLPDNWRPGMSADLFVTRLRKVAMTGVPDTLNLEWETESGPICHEIHMVAERGADGAQVGVLAIGRNISARRKAERQLLHQATHDALTGLPNRSLLRDRLQHALVRARREGRRCAVIFIDLDNFKEINDSLGHDSGDELLKIIAERMQIALREGDTIARLGGDEFVIVTEGCTSNQDLDAVMTKLFAAVTCSCDLLGQRIYPAASLGVAVFPEDGMDAESLMRNADMAMYAAKGQGRNHYRFFSPRMNAELNEWIDLNASMRLALENQEFELHYQPKASLTTGDLSGMEALIRWRHPEKGLISPARFIPVAEKSGLIGAIGNWVLQEACRQIRLWLDAGIDPGRVAVNLSAVQCRSGRLDEQIAETLAKYGLTGFHLEVEITESIVMNDAEESIRAFWGLRDMGVRVVVDDFGTGYSSLSYLKRLPVDGLKVDKSFVDDVESDANDIEIIKAIIAMAHSLSLSVVAEGVETEGQIDCLRRLGCDQIQGYYLSRPLEPDSMESFLRLNKTA